MTFIRLSSAGGISQAKTVTDKRAMLDDLGPKDALLAAWTGQWSTDIFWLDAKLARKELD